MNLGRCISLEVIHMHFKETLRMSADRANFRSAGADYNMTTVAAFTTGDTFAVTYMPAIHFAMLHTTVAVDALYGI